MNRARCPRRRWGPSAVGATSPYTNGYFFTYTSFIQPTTLYYADEAGAVKDIKRLPVMWDSSGMRVEQLEATSKDGTKIPFFIVSRDGLKTTARIRRCCTRTAASRSANTPAYATTLGRGVARTGGTYVVANIRGGGEFGPAVASRRPQENRQRIYEDFIAVAEELIRERLRRRGTWGSWAAATAGCSSASR